MLRIRTFGGLAVTHPERELAGAVLQPRRLAILAVLARAGQRGMSREKLMAMFWPDDEEERSRKALAQAIYALRRDLQAEDAIVGTREVALNADLIRSDVGDFAAFLKQGRYAEAAALYDGGFLEGFHLVGASEFERWADDERTLLQHDYARIVERLAKAADKDGQHEDAVRWWRALTTLDPLNSTTAVGYMKALDAAGDRATAIKHARIYEALMAQELELPPDKEVLELAAMLKTKAPAAPVTVAPSVPVPSTVVEVPGTMNEVPGTSTPPEPPTASAAAPEPVPVPSTPYQVPGTTNEVSGTGTPKAARRTPLFAALAVVAAAAVFWIVRQSRPDPLASLRVSDTRRVTAEEALELDPAVSPDGRMVAYAGGSEGNMHLYVRQLDGGSAVLVSGSLSGDHRRPRWSPDGSRLLFQANRGIWMIPSLGGTARPIVEPPADTLQRAAYPAWSPDGTQLAWVEKSVVYTRAIDGGTPRALATVPAGHSLVWSPDGQFIAAASNNDGFVYGSLGTIGYSGANIGNIGPGTLFVVRVATGDTTRLLTDDFLSTSPDWLGDSRHLVFVSNRDRTRDLYALAITDDGHVRGEPVRLTTGLDAHTVSVARDGKTLAYTTFRQSANLWSLPISTGAPLSATQATQVTSGQQLIEALDVSPNGEWLTYDSDLNGQQDIFRVRTSGGEPERIVSGPSDEFHPFWSPDGKQLVFYRIRNGVRRGVIASADGGAERYISADGGTLEEHSPVFTPDGQHLIYQRYIALQPDLYQVTRTGDSSWSAPERLTTHGGSGPVFSPDGRRMAYMSGPGEVSLLDVGAPESARRVIVSRGTPNGLTVIQIRWPAGKSVLYARTIDAKGNKGIWEFSESGGAWRELVRFDDARRQPVRHEFATDGRRFFFTLPERSADVWSARLDQR